MESAPLLISPLILPAEAGWTKEPDEEVNGTTGWQQLENKTFFFLAQPPPGEVFDWIKTETGSMRLVGRVSRITTERLIFQGGQKIEELKFYPRRILVKYWNEARQPQHRITGRTVEILEADPQFALDVEYEFDALQFAFSPPRTALAQDKDFAVPFDIESKKP
jgi:hypothetical protein